MRAVALGLSWLLGVSGCGSVLVDAEAGPTFAPAHVEGRTGAAITLGSGMNLSNDQSAESGGVGMDLRGRVTRDVQEVAFGPHLYVLADSLVTPFARVGASLVELGSVDDDFSFGMFGPHAQLGMVWAPFALSAVGSYSIRFGPDDDAFVGLLFGWGFGGTTRTVREAF
ncbi:MAG: hypothetical protein KC492_13280 [Myxococcales bacterium]|nr:hypothetical protein [Myxococcales bacterium]